jgi:glycine cleavage system pyridoxal-binding protein P
VSKAKAHGAVAICATDLLALTILENPGSFGFDIAVGIYTLILFNIST